MSDTVPAEGGAAVPAKEDPETLVLRGKPRPVVRFRRGFVIGAIATAAACLIGAAWLALEPPALRLTADDRKESAEPARMGVPDALAAAPGDYGDVPLLGPPLPGDLGGPILEHRRSLEAPEAGTGPVASTRLDPAEAQRQRRAAAREAARASGVLVPLTGAGEQTGNAAPLPQAAAVPAAPATTGVPSRRLLERALADTGDGNPHRLREAPSPWTLAAGTVIPASLITGLNSDLPGTVLAQVTENVRDSATGRTVLIPQGARLIGSYDSAVAYGRRRVLVVWHRIVLPDGSSIRLDDAPAADVSGHAGLEDEVDFHTWRLLKGIVLSTLLGVGTELGLGSGESELVRALREATQQNAARAGDRIVSRDLDVAPTVTVRPGWPLRAIVHENLVLRPWKG